MKLSIQIPSSVCFIYYFYQKDQAPDSKFRRLLLHPNIHKIYEYKNVKTVINIDKMKFWNKSKLVVNNRLILAFCIKLNSKSLFRVPQIKKAKFSKRGHLKGEIKKRAYWRAKGQKEGICPPKGIVAPLLQDEENLTIGSLNF